MFELMTTMRLLVNELEPAVAPCRLSEPPAKVTWPVPKEALPVVFRAPSSTTVPPG